MSFANDAVKTDDQTQTPPTPNGPLEKEDDDNHNKNHLSTSTTSSTVSPEASSPKHRPQQSIVLFYKYHPLSADATVTERYRSALEDLCKSLQLKGRILVACSRSEGINGTLSGDPDRVRAFTQALLRNSNDAPPTDPLVATALTTFRAASRRFFADLGEAELVMDSPQDFKWSSSSASSTTTAAQPSPKTDDAQSLFPDLNIKLTRELIGTGGIMEQIPLEETGQGYLTPQQWHAEMQHLKKQSDDDTTTTKSNTILIDCRNTKEYAIGHFPGAVDPQTTTYSQFPHWVQQNPALLHNKRVLMYCTGGIRCEKASAYVRRVCPTVREVAHLKGGIHKYLEAYGGEGLWRGKNFVFDGRLAAAAEETRQGKASCGTAKAEESSQQTLENDNNMDQATAALQPTLDTNNKDSNAIVGTCLYCSSLHDSFDGKCVCTVCREPVLVCPTCRASMTRPEWHCRQHFHLKDIYFTNLQGFSQSELQDQLKGLQHQLDLIAVGKKFRQKRKTLAKQWDRVMARLQELNNGGDTGNRETLTRAEDEVSDDHSTVCRSCGDPACAGRCWGFFGLKRKDRLEQQLQQKETALVPSTASSSLSNMRSKGTAARGSPPPKKARRGTTLHEIHDLGLRAPPSSFRDTASAIRVPPTVTRLVQCAAKAKWCGRSVSEILHKEFSEFAETKNLQAALEYGVVYLNGTPLEPLEASFRKVRDGDILSRVLHWHEPPVIVPERISVTRVACPGGPTEGSPSSRDNSDDWNIYVCNKPASVPVHPAGPYLSNCLTVMVEAQEAFEIGSLKPLHRTDRVTSGLTMCCRNTELSKRVCRAITEGLVQKLYVAKVGGKFPSSSQDVTSVLPGVCWCSDTNSVLVDAPVFTPDPQTGLRIVSDQGKPAKSVFSLLSYIPEEDSSLVACFPITGRNHQLRLHLKVLGHPILGDVLYGGPSLCSSPSCSKDSAVKLMKNPLRANGQPVPNVFGNAFDSARKACRCCKLGPREVFTSAQLLVEGHAIRLHALRYKLRLPLTQQSRSDFCPELTLEVEPPEWLDTRVISELIWPAKIKSHAQ